MTSRTKTFLGFEWHIENQDIWEKEIQQLQQVKVQNDAPASPQVEIGQEFDLNQQIPRRSDGIKKTGLSVNICT